jgi:hypothetical protein
MEKGSTRAGLSRRQLIKRGAVVGGAAIWVPPVIQSLRMPAFGQVGSPQPPLCIVDGFMTGGGFIDMASGVKVHYQLLKFDCPPLTSPPELKVSWSTGKGATKVDYDFQLDTFTSRLCTNNPNIADGPNANFDTAVGTGTGELKINNVTQTGSIQFAFVDGGEGNSSSDTVTLIIFDAGNNVILTIVNQLVDGGNIQAHDGNWAFGDACV